MSTVARTHHSADCKRVAAARKHLNDHMTRPVIEEIFECAKYTLEETIKAADEPSTLSGAGADEHDTGMCDMMSLSGKYAHAYRVTDDQFSSALTAHTLKACVPDSLPVALDGTAGGGGQRKHGAHTGECAPHKRVRFTSDDIERSTEKREGLVNFGDYRPLIEDLRRGAPEMKFVSSATGFSVPVQQRTMTAYYPINARDTYTGDSDDSDDVQIVEPPSRSEHVLEEAHVEPYAAADEVKRTNLAPLSYTQPSKSSKFWSQFVEKYGGGSADGTKKSLFDLTAHDGIYEVRNPDGTQRRKKRGLANTRLGKTMQEATMLSGTTTSELRFCETTTTPPDDVVISSLPATPVPSDDDDMHGQSSVALDDGHERGAVAGCAFRRSLHTFINDVHTQWRHCVATALHGMHDDDVRAAVDLATRCVQSGLLPDVLRIVLQRHRRDESSQAAAATRCRTCRAGPRLCALTTLALYISFRTNRET